MTYWITRTRFVKVVHHITGAVLMQWAGTAMQLALLYWKWWQLCYRDLCACWNCLQFRRCVVKLCAHTPEKWSSRGERVFGSSGQVFRGDFATLADGANVFATRSHGCKLLTRNGINLWTAYICHGGMLLLTTSIKCSLNTVDSDFNVTIFTCLFCSSC